MKFALTLASFALASSMSTFAMASNDKDTIDIQVVDYSGKPPFKRVVKTVPISDVAQLEALGETATEYVEVKEVIKRGKPPFRRVTTRMPVYDVAQFELLDEQNEPKLKGSRPPFKRHK